MNVYWHHSWRTRMLLLCLSVLYASTGICATSYQYTNPGTPITFGDSGQTYAWTLSNRTTGTGQVSARADKGGGAQPSLWEMRCTISLTGTLTIGATLEYYIATSDGSVADANVGTVNASITSDQRRALMLAGVLVVYQSTQNTKMYASFRNLYIPSRYFSLAIWNATAISTETVTNNLCSMTPMPNQMQ